MEYEDIEEDTKEGLFTLYVIYACIIAIYNLFVCDCISVIVVDVRFIFNFIRMSRLGCYASFVHCKGGQTGTCSSR